jgi:hypothetical protein
MLEGETLDGCADNKQFGDFYLADASAEKDS